MAKKKATTAPARARLIEPRGREQLRAFIEQYLGVRVRDRALISAHSAPMDYLEHSFFGDREGPRAPSDCVVWANRGGGKTFLGAVATLLDMLFKPGITIRILGGSDHQSRLMLAHLRRLLDGAQHPEIVSVARPEILTSGVTFANGSNVEVMSQAQTSVRGARVQKLRCDEVDLFKPEIWEACQLTTITKRCGKRNVVGTIECLSTMQNYGGMMSRVVAEAQEGRRRLFRWGVLDVLGVCGAERECRSEREECALYTECRGAAKEVEEGEGGHLSVRDAVTLKSRVGIATWNAEMLCQQPRRSESVYPEFERGVHTLVRTEMPEGVRACASGKVVAGHRVVAGMDFGFANPTAIVWAVEDDCGALWVIAEYERSEKRLDEQAAMIVRGELAPVPEWIGVDPAGLARSHQTGASSVDVLREAGLRVITPRHELAAGINTVRALLAPASELSKPRLRVEAECRALTACLEAYKNSANGGAPQKTGADHLCDALRYMVMAGKRRVADRVEDYC